MSIVETKNGRLLTLANLQQMGKEGCPRGLRLSNSNLSTIQIFKLKTKKENENYRERKQKGG